MSDHDDQIIEPIPEIMDLLDQARRAWLADNFSKQEIARWLSSRAKALNYCRPITAVGLKKRLFSTQKNIAKHRVA